MFAPWVRSGGRSGANRCDRASWRLDEAGVPTLEHFMKLVRGSPHARGSRCLPEGTGRAVSGDEHINISTPMSAPESVMLEQLDGGGGGDAEV